MVNLIPLFWGYFIDLLIGDPIILPHPVRFIGLCITKIEKILRRKERNLFIKGFILLIIVSSFSFFIPYFIIYYTSMYNYHVALVIESFMIFQILATKSLYTETNKVYKSLITGDIEMAKKHLSYLVTRDCENMSEAEIIRSTIETISENIVDGITSPLFYITLGGAPLGMLYKSVNTLDSMVGYKNKKYITFGFFSAKFDDCINYIPARITSLYIILSSFLLNKSFKQSIKIFVRDKRNHSSPNSGYAEAPVAGALGIRLGGKVSYFGEEHNKPTIGDDLREPNLKDIKDTHKIMIMTSFLFFVSCLLIQNFLI